MTIHMSLAVRGRSFLLDEAESCWPEGEAIQKEGFVAAHV